MKPFILTLLFSLLLSCISAQSYQRDCKTKVDIIDRMPLRVVYPVPIDTLGRVVNEGFLTLELSTHCELLAEIPKNVRAVALYYLDGEGRLRKVIQSFADGGGLNYIAYYDEQGELIYAIFGGVYDGYGEVFAHNSLFYLEHRSSSLDNFQFNFVFEATTHKLLSEYKIKWQVPDGCKIVHFTSLEKGDHVFLCTNELYSSPNGRLLNPCEGEICVDFGHRLIVSSIENDWCRLEGMFGESVGYVRIDHVKAIKTECSLPK